MADIVDLQHHYLARVKTDPSTPYLLYGEHPPVFTVGRAHKQHYSAELMGIPVAPVSRGGRLTYHGPGQLVIYPIVPLRAVGGVPALLQALQEWLCNGLTQLGFQPVTPPPCGTPDKPATGVWVYNASGQPVKVASIGLALKHWISYHGVALNISNDLTPFYAIDPCGYTPQVMSSLNHVWAEQRPGHLPPSQAQVLQALGLAAQ